MKTNGHMRVLMSMTYKGNHIYVRMIGTDMYLWDAVYDGQIYSSYIIMKPAKGRLKLTPAETDEVVKMCYSGAATTIDTLMGVELSETDAAVVDRFEKAMSTTSKKGIN